MCFGKRQLRVTPCLLQQAVPPWDLSAWSQQTARRMVATEWIWSLRVYWIRRKERGNSFIEWQSLHYPRNLTVCNALLVLQTFSKGCLCKILKTASLGNQESGNLGFWGAWGQGEKEQ